VFKYGPWSRIAFGDRIIRLITNLLDALLAPVASILILNLILHLTIEISPEGLLHARHMHSLTRQIRPVHSRVVCRNNKSSSLARLDAGVELLESWSSEVACSFSALLCLRGVDSMYEIVRAQLLS
jgi:hypothetical protein